MHQILSKFYKKRLVVVILTGLLILYLFLSSANTIPRRGHKIEENFAGVRACLSSEKSQHVVCLNKILRAIAEKQGIRKALDTIEPLSQEFTYLLEWSHPFAHSIGQHGLAFYRALGVPLESGVGRALVECDGFGAFGCYHGVIETGLSLLPVERRASVIRQACMENPLIQEKQYFVNQCLHWFGHGLAIFANISLKETLAMCEGLNINFLSDEVQLCLSGVFHAGPVPGESDPTLLHNVKNVWREGDSYFPCLDIEERFRGHCYSHAAARTLSNDLAVNFQTCSNIPEPDPVKKLDYVRRCYDSAANTLLALTLKRIDLTDEEKIEKIIHDCKTYTLPEYRRFCYAGTARYWVLRDPFLTNTNPFKICRKVEEEAKPACYANVGFGNNENYYSKEKLREYCTNSETRFVESCLARTAL